MADNALHRKLATIVALDVAGYSARTEADEAKTTAEVAALRGVIEKIAARHDGRIFSTAGDGFMLEFTSSLAAVEAAAELAETCEPKVRVGVHLGDVIVQPNGDLLGHGVNVAARLMSKSEPGSALISATVSQTIRGPLADRLVSRGFFHLDKMSETVEAFAIGTNAAPKAPVRPSNALQKQFGRNPVLAGAFAVAALALIAIVASFAWRTAPPPANKSIAILPFENRSQSQTDAEYGDWLSELVNSLLGKARELKVIAHTSASAFKGKAMPVPDIAHQLGVAVVLEGSVRGVGQDVVIRAGLVDAATNTQLWSDTYQRRNDNELAVQSEVASKIADSVADTLKVTLAQSERQAVSPQTDPQAFEAYLTAVKLYRTSAEPNVRTAQPLLNKAVELDANFTVAWALLSRVHSFLYFNGSDATEGRRAAAKEALDKALGQDRDLAEVMLADAYFDYWVKRDYDNARQKFEKLIAKWPSNASVLSALAAITRRQGKWEESKAYFERAVVIDPLHAGRRLYAASLHIATRDFDGARSRLDTAIAMFSDANDRIPFVAKKALILQLQGDLEGAAKLLEGLTPAPDGALIEPIVLQALMRREPKAAIALLETLQKQDDAKGSPGRTSIDLNLYLGNLRRLAGDARGARRNDQAALDELRVELAKQPDSADIHSYLAQAYAGLGDRTNATKHAAIAVQTVPITKDALSGAYYLDIQARVWAALGDRDAIPAIEALLKRPAPTPLTPALLRLDPDFDRLRTDARFQALTAQTP